MNEQIAIDNIQKRLMISGNKNKNNKQSNSMNHLQPSSSSYKFDEIN